jgi:polycomb protein EED
MISTFSFPETTTQYVTPNLHVYHSPAHDPVVLFTYPNSTLISVLNVIHLQPRKPPSFPLDSEGEHLAETTERMHLGDQRGSIEVSPLISKWEIKTVSSGNTSVQTDDLPETLMASAMGMGGQIIVAVGVRGTVWIWNERHV